MKKKKTAAILLAALMLTPYTVQGAAANVAAQLVPHFKLIDNGRLIDTSSDSPILYNEKTYVPLRLVSEALGYEVTWDGSAQAIHFKRPDASYPLLQNEGVEILSAEPKYEIITALDSSRYLGSVHLEIVYQIPEDLDREPIFTLEQLNKDQTVLTSDTDLLNKKKGIHKTTVFAESISLPYKMEEGKEAAIKKMSADYFYRYKLK